jgi:hypothetical protein
VASALPLSAVLNSCHRVDTRAPLNRTLDRSAQHAVLPACLQPAYVYMPPGTQRHHSSTQRVAYRSNSLCFLPSLAELQEHHPSKSASRIHWTLKYGKLV